MDILIFLYNIILLVLFGAVCTLAFVSYKKLRQPLYLAVGILFLIYICDNTIIYMTEFISWFSVKYDTQFMTVPAFKTISILSQSACTLYICNAILNRKIPLLQYVVVLAQAFILMFVPMMADSAYKVWLYYLPCQIYLFWLGIYGLLSIKTSPGNYAPKEVKTIKKLFQYTILFSILILIEDTIVIFNFDTYSQLIVRINNRNICEDIMTIVYSFFSLRIFMGLLGAVPVLTPMPLPEPVLTEPSDQGRRLENSNREEAAAITHPVPDPAVGISPVLAAVITAADSEADIIDHFSEHYELTGREKEIFTYLIQDKNNQEICDHLCISIGTVKAHVHNIFVKTDAVKRSQVIRIYKDFTKDYLKTRI